MEYLDICTENGAPAGQTVERSIAHRKGILHRTAHVWIIREEKGKTEILLQKRSRNKDSFPGFYDTSSAGHIPAGDEPLPSALRELKEELGIQTDAGKLNYAGMFRSQYEKEFHGKMFRDNEVTTVYVYEEPVDTDRLKLQKEEVEEVRWFELEKVYEEIQTSRERFCVPKDGLKVLIDYLERRRKTEKAENRQG